MKNTLVSNSYRLVWEYSESPNYKFTQCGKCINTQRGKELKKVLNGYTVGFCLNGKFNSLSQIREKLQKIKKVNVPF